MRQEEGPTSRSHFVASPPQLLHTFGYFVGSDQQRWADTDDGTIEAALTNQ